MKRTWIPLALALCLCLAASSVAAQDAKLKDFWAACRNGEVAKVREFLDSGISVNARFDAGITPLFAAAMRGQVEVAKLLVERGADLSLRDDSYRMTPLGAALFSGQPAVAEYLMPLTKHDLDVALLFGVLRNQPKLVEAGLKSQPSAADLTRALAVAKRRPEPNAEIVALLEKAGAAMPAELKPEEISRFTGYFKDASQMELEIVLRDGKLIGTGGSSFEAFFEQEMVSLAPDLLMVSSDPTLTYKFAGSGKQYDRATMQFFSALALELKRTEGNAK